MSDSFWAITTYFNPIDYNRRLANYHVFRKFLTGSLLTVEWSPTGEFQLQKNDADILIQLSGGDVMWQKERLLNIALQNLPSSCDKVAWLDCDIVFANKDWKERAYKLLDDFAVIQLFKTVRYAPDHLLPDDVGLDSLSSAETILRGDSLAFQLVQNSQRVEDIAKYYKGQNDGLACAASKEILVRHGFYDARIVGGGGMGIIKAACGNFNEYVEERSFSPLQTDHYLEWAIPYFETVKGNISFVDCDIYHLWHGDLSNRQYSVRQQKLNEYDFDPYTDITVGDNGCLYWDSDKPELHQYVKDYFKRRKEDGD